MQFNSIRDFFNALYNILYGILLVPLLAFVYLYLEQQAGRLEPILQQSGLIVTVLAVIVIVDWGVSFALFNNGLKRARQLTLLGERLQHLRYITIVRYVLISSSCLLLAVGFYFTSHQALTALFVVSMILQSSFWPTTYRVCDQLELKGEEREMVIRKQDVK